MTDARVAMAEARARMERIASDPDASALFAPDNELISKLRSDLLDLSVRANDIESRVGKDHLAAVKVRNRMEEVRKAIASEQQKRITGSSGRDYELARARYDELSATVSRVMGEEGANSEVKARMRELEGAADTLRSLYDRMLQQSSQMNRVEGQPSITPDVRVLMRAPPADRIPGEGKTTVAINLAAHFALHSTTRVLVIDADFHRQSLTNIVAPDARVGFREALKEPSGLAKFIVRKERLNLDALPCPVPDRVTNAAKLLGSAEMKQLIEVAREAYDLVIIEAPPMAAVVDYKMVARHCNGFVFVVEWGKTSQRLVLECLSDASALMDRVLCMVLNKVDPSALRSIERYKGQGFNAYYSDQKRA